MSYHRAWGLLRDGASVVTAEGEDLVRLDAEAIVRWTSEAE